MISLAVVTWVLDLCGLFLDSIKGLLFEIYGSTVPAEDHPVSPMFTEANPIR